MPRPTTAAGQQAALLAKLQADPTKLIILPPPPPSGLKQLRAPQETIKNVQGSSAGAGSGEFHVYKESRRREYERIGLMLEEDRLEIQEREDLERNRNWKEAEELKLDKNRAKRERRKKGKRGIEKEPKTGAVEGEREIKKVKMAGGITFKSKNERDEEEELVVVAPVQEEKVEEVIEEERRAVEAGIRIVDSD